ncbi:hypothetical protein D3C76_1274340 [compost metagenome]
MQVAHVLAVVADAIKVEVVAGIETADADAVETGVFAAAHVGYAAQGLGDVLFAILQRISHLHRIDGLRHVARRGRRAGGRGHVLDPRVVRVAVGCYRNFRQRGGAGGAGKARTE